MKIKRRISLLAATLAAGVTFGSGAMTAQGAVRAGGTEHVTTCVRAGQAPVIGRADALNGVTVISRCDAWAVGWWSANGVDPRTLILHWNGAKWQQVPGANVPGDNALNGVAAVSAKNIWAVGFISTAASGTTLIEHWNGSTWSRVPSPSPGTVGVDDQLAAVAALSARDAWAVGDGGGGAFTLVEHWNGSVWRRVKSPDPGPVSEDSQFNTLSGVAIESATDAWAVGNYEDPTPCCFVSQTLILHWDGHVWKRVRSVNPGGRDHSDNALSGVAALSRRDAWAVGFGGTSSLILHWNGRSWRAVPSPRPGSSASLGAVDAASRSSAWAVGSWTGRRGDRTLMVHWNGRAWRLVGSPNPGPRRYSEELAAIAGKSCATIWAVGRYSGTSPRGAQVSRSITARC